MEEEKKENKMNRYTEAGRTDPATFAVRSEWSEWASTSLPRVARSID